jgi:hypothetical protein
MVSRRLGAFIEALDCLLPYAEVMKGLAKEGEAAYEIVHSLDLLNRTEAGGAEKWALSFHSVGWGISEESLQVLHANPTSLAHIRAVVILV